MARTGRTRRRRSCGFVVAERCGPASVAAGGSSAEHMIGGVASTSPSPTSSVDSSPVRYNHPCQPSRLSIQGRAGHPSTCSTPAPSACAPNSRRVDLSRHTRPLPGYQTRHDPAARPPHLRAARPAIPAPRLWGAASRAIGHGASYRTPRARPDAEASQADRGRMALLTHSPDAPRQDAQRRRVHRGSRRGVTVSHRRSHERSQRLLSRRRWSRSEGGERRCIVETVYRLRTAFPGDTGVGYTRTG